MLNAQGADDYLAGYYGFYDALFADLVLRLHWLTLVREAIAAWRAHGPAEVQLAGHIAGALLPEPVRQRFRRALGRPAVGREASLD